ncbi:hypothetical protein AAVH_13631 [Aphelenchoides avenae]|nr:hypothetical protein AAVH_13631 [Aphelenchus avenae]
MPTDSIIYEANAEELRVWNFNAMRTELHQPADGTHREWKAGDWIQKDDGGRLTQLTEPPLDASSNGADGLTPVKATVPVIRVPDFEDAFGLSTAADRNKRFFSPVVGPVDNFADASVFPENVLLDMSVFKCSDHMKNAIKQKHGIGPDWLFALKQQAVPVTSEANEKYEQMLDRWGRPRREGVVLRSAGNSHVISYMGKDNVRRLCVARDAGLTFGKLVSFYVIDVGFNAPVKFAAGCRAKEETGLCQDGDQVLVPRSLIFMGHVVLPHMGVFDVPRGFEGQETIAFRMKLDLERGSLCFAPGMPPRPDSLPHTVTTMPRTAIPEQVDSHTPETEITEQTQTASSSAASASSKSQNGDEPSNLNAIMAQLAQEMTMFHTQDHASTAATRITAEQQDAEKDSQSSPLLEVADAEDTASVPDTSEKSESSANVKQANAELSEETAYTTDSLLRELLSHIVERKVVGVVVFHQRDKDVDAYFAYSPVAGIEAEVVNAPAGIKIGMWLEFNVALLPGQENYAAVESRIVQEVVHVIPMWRSAAVQCEVSVPDSRAVQGEQRLESNFAHEVRDPLGIAKDRAAGNYLATIRYDFNGTEPTGHWVLEYLDQQQL